MTKMTEAEYRDALKEIESLMSATSGSAQGARLDGLVTQVESYERELGLEALLTNSPAERLTLSEEDEQWIHAPSVGKEL